MTSYTRWQNREQSSRWFKNGLLRGAVRSPLNEVCVVIGLELGRIQLRRRPAIANAELPENPVYMILHGVT